MLGFLESPFTFFFMVSVLDFYISNTRSFRWWARPGGTGPVFELGRIFFNLKKTKCELFKIKSVYNNTATSSKRKIATNCDSGIQHTHFGERHSLWKLSLSSSSSCGRGRDFTHNFAPNSLICHGCQKVLNFYINVINISSVTEADIYYGKSCATLVLSAKCAS